MKNDDLFNNHLNLVYKIVSKMDYGYIEKDDLLQAGLYGLYKASINYNKKISNNFINYASFYIISEIKNELRTNKLITNSKKICKIHKALLLDENKKKSVDELSILLDCKKEDILLAIDYNETIIDNDSIYIDDNHLLKNEYMILISKLDDISRKIIIYKYFKNYSQKEIANKLKCSQSKVSRLEQIALNFIRNNI